MRVAFAAAIVFGMFSLFSVRAAVVTDCNEASLRGAVEQGGTVTFACDGVITLSNAIQITADVALDGQGHDVTISGGGKVRLFDSRAGAHIRLIHLILADGKVQGTNGYISRNGESVEGGGLRMVGGTLEASDCQFVHHSSVGGKGGDATADPGTFPANGGDAQGGAIYAKGTFLYLTNCGFQLNSGIGGPPGSRAIFGQPIFGSPGTGEGGVISMDSGRLVLDGCSFLQDSANNGGALRLEGVQLFSVRSRFEKCSASGRGGAAYLRYEKAEFTNCLFAFNMTDAVGLGAGGAIFVEGTDLTVSDSAFATNSARGNDAYPTPRGYVAAGDGEGGALHLNNCTARIQRCAAIGNSAVGGGAFPVLGALGGQAVGGAIWSGGQGVVTLENCTLLRNQAIVAAVPLSFPDSQAAARGGAAAGLGGTLSFSYCTIASNAVSSGGAVAGGGCLAGNTFILRNSILAWNTTNGAPNNVFGSVTGDHNVSSDATPSPPMPLTQWNVDPRFDRLDTHGGQTLTLALLPDSPAIDAGDSNFCPPTDQRGASRPSLHGCDVGAFEFVPTGFRIASIQLVDLGTVRIEGTGVPDEDFELEESSDLMLWHVAGTGRVDRYGLFTLQAPRAPELSFYRVAAP